MKTVCELKNCDFSELSHLPDEKFFYLTDHLGSTVLMTDDQGNILWQNDFSPFGEETGESGFVERDGFYTGKKIDRDTGLYYFNARWYDPQLGRFITEDPVKDGVNWFSYVANNPLTMIDPTGLYGMTADDYNSMKDEQKDSYSDYRKEERREREEARRQKELESQKTYSYEELTQGATFPNEFVDEKTRYLSNSQWAVQHHLNYQANSRGVFEENGPEGEGKTWCNTSTQAVAQMTGFNMEYLRSRVDNKIISDVTANEAYQILLENAAEPNNLFLIDMESASKFANVGFTVIAASTGRPQGHMSTVAPGYEFNSRRGPKVANVSTEDITKPMYAKDAFGPQYDNIRFYVDIQQFANDANPNNIGKPIY